MFRRKLLTLPFISGKITNQQPEEKVGILKYQDENKAAKLQHSSERIPNHRLHPRIVIMKMNHFLSVADYSEPELMHILDVAKQLKAELKAGGNQPILAGKTLALVFQADNAVGFGDDGHFIAGR